MRKVWVKWEQIDFNAAAAAEWEEKTMPIRADYHLHSNFSGDSQAPMEDMIKKAISLGFTDLCFTEHMDMDYPVTQESPEGFFTVNTDSYLFDLLKYREAYKEQLNLLFGIELGVQPQIARKLSLYAKSYDFDFIIASTHTVKGFDPYYPSYYEGRSDEEAYRSYFEEVLSCMKSFTNFDIYGHIDYVIRYGKTRDRDYCYEKYQDLFEKMIDFLLENEKGIELNTGGLRKGLKDVHPCSAFLRRYRQKGGEIITVGSDAHRPEDLGADFDTAAKVLKDCGFDYYCTFANRVPTYHKL